MWSSLGMYYHGHKLSICSPESDKLQVDYQAYIPITVLTQLEIYCFLSADMPSTLLETVTRHDFTVQTVDTPDTDTPLGWVLIFLAAL